MEDRPLRIGRYRLEARVASGGMASVHMGWLYGDAGFGRLVAIKRLHPHLAEQPAFVDMLLDEARLASRVRHPNVVPILDVVREGHELLLVMEYVLGLSLAELVRLAVADGRPLAPPVVSAIGAGVLAGLHAAHEATDERGRALGIVHRDVSPQNVLVGADGVPRLVDFGIAKAVGRLQTTMTGMLKGKLAYMAPEQRRAGAVDRRADLYALALTLREALTGEAPPPEPDAAPPPAPGTPLESALALALPAAPERRVANAQQMARELAAAVPPAPAADLAALVAELGDELLRARRALMSRVERAAAAPAPGPEAASARTERLGPRRAVRRALVGAGLVAGLGGAAALLLGLRGQARPPAGPARAARRLEGGPAPPPPPAPAAAAVPPVDPATAAPVDPATAAPPASAPRPAPEPPPSRDRRAAAKTRPRRAVRPSPASCDPPFAVGPDGVKRYKIECLED